MYEIILNDVKWCILCHSVHLVCALFCVAMCILRMVSWLGVLWWSVCVWWCHIPRGNNLHEDYHLLRCDIIKVPALCWFLAWLILWPWRWTRYVPPKRWLTFSGLHGVISQKIELFNDSTVHDFISGHSQHNAHPFSGMCSYENCGVWIV
jgi:hypothetical protein